MDAFRAAIIRAHRPGVRPRSGMDFCAALVATVRLGIRDPAGHRGPTKPQGGRAGETQAAAGAGGGRAPAGLGRFFEAAAGPCCPLRLHEDGTANAEASPGWSPTVDEGKEAPRPPARP